MTRRGGAKRLPQTILFASQSLQVLAGGRWNALDALQLVQRRLPLLATLVDLGQIRLQATGVELDEDVLQDAPAWRRLAQRAQGARALALLQQFTAGVEGAGAGWPGW